MFRISKTFKFPMGHRLSKHAGACKNFHGHNYNVDIGMASPKLNKDDMVIDFGILKQYMKPYFEKLDHATILNQYDEHAKTLLDMKMKIILYDTDPTAERMAEQIFFYIHNQIGILQKDSENDELMVEYVTVYETDGAKATYSMG